MVIQTQRGWLRASVVTETKVESWGDGWSIAYHAPQGWVWGIERYESKAEALEAARKVLDSEQKLATRGGEQ
jgi:hypothetical protein